MTEAEQREALRKKQEYEDSGIPVDRLKICHGLKLEQSFLWEEGFVKFSSFIL